MSLHSRIAFVAAGGLLSLVASTRDADACSLPPCQPLFSLPARGEMPANAVAFRVIAQEVGDAKIVDDTGAVVETAVSPDPVDGGWLFRPKSPLVGGNKYKLVYPNVCVGTGPGSGTADKAHSSNEYSFYAGEPAEYPKTSGTLVIAEHALIDVEGDAPTIVTRLAWKPSGEMAPFFAMAGAGLELDGKPMYTLGVLQEGGLISVPAFCGKLESWGPTTCGDYQNAPPGKHTIRLTPNIAGASTQPAATELEIEVSCDPKSVLAASTKITDPNVTPTSGDAGNGGCTLSAQRAPGNALAAFGLILGWLFLARARRSRAS